MALKDVLQAALNELGWEDEILRNDDNDTDYVITGYRIDGHSYRLTMLTDEGRQWLRLVLTAPMSMPEGRRVDAAVPLNRLNCSIGMTHFEMNPDGTVACHHTIDVENADASPALFRNMLSAASGAFSPARVTALGALAFTRQPLETILADFELDYAARAMGAPVGETH